MFSYLLAAVIAQAGATAPERAPADDPVVCSARGESSLGTKIPAKRRCIRKSQWAAEQAEAQQQLRDLRKYVPPPKSTAITQSTPQ